MAKRHENGSDGGFALETGAWGPIESHVGTMNIEAADGTMHKFAKSDLQTKKTFKTQSGGTVERDVWRFAGTRNLPFPRAASNRDELVANIARFMDDLVAYDAADSFMFPDGRVGKKGFKVLVDSKGEAITPEQYIYGLLQDAHTLANQKVMQTKLRNAAEQTLRGEMGIEAPSKAIRQRKVTDQVVDEGETVNDL